MSPRIKSLGICLFTLLWLLGPAAGKDVQPQKNTWIIQLYQDHLSGADGSRCPMYPSCSEYAARAVKKHGSLMGWIMACDRILRCGRSETARAPETLVNGRPKTHDPVSANDFWWFAPHQEKDIQ